eukprot:748020-Hanusia_phi.AAC.5
MREEGVQSLHGGQGKQSSGKIEEVWKLAQEKGQEVYSEGNGRQEAFARQRYKLSREEARQRQKKGGGRREGGTRLKRWLEAKGAEGLHGGWDMVQGVG